MIINYLKGRIRSFGFAFQGIATLFRTQPNAAIHLLAAVLAVALGFCLHISALEWCVIVIIIGAVLAAEALNSAVEMLADKVSPEFSPLIKNAKDLAAAAVLFLAFTAIIIAAIIFIPRLITLY
ncbi:MAG: diacylglycerol kinase family protein [Bacteroidales bacterium]|nr:diacylglycerol kinase family protein [Bacteroidales bacterium]